MDDVLTVHVVQAVQHLVHQVGRLVLGYLLLSVARHAAIGHALHNQIDFGLVIEEPVQSGHVPVSQV